MGHCMSVAICVQARSQGGVYGCFRAPRKPRPFAEAHAARWSLALPQREQDRFASDAARRGWEPSDAARQGWERVE